jgi:hypothetical protein
MCASVDDTPGTDHGRSRGQTRPYDARHGVLGAGLSPADGMCAAVEVLLLIERLCG